MVNPFPRHKTKIVCTIGPASRKKSVLKDLVRAGMNVARLNFSHGDLTQHAQDIQTIRQVSQELGRTVAILGDLPGPKIRIGVLKGGACTLNKGNRVVLTTRQVQGTADLIPVQFPDLPRSVKPGERIFLNDGFIELKVLEIKGEDIICRVVIGGGLLSNKGMNLPDAHLSLSAATDEDLGFIAFGIEQGIDMFGLSFVGGAQDISRVREFARTKGSEIFVVAKMERREAVKNSREIIEAVDAVMVARGDLGVDGGLYRVLEIEGPAITSLDLSNRLTISNMAIEAGAKAGIIRADEKTEAYVRPRAKRPYTIYESDADARYASIREYDCANIEPQVAFPHLPENTRPISEVGEVRIDQVVIGSCTNGRIEDLRVAAGILKGQKVDKRVRCVILPATPEVFLQAEEEGLIKIFLQAGAIIGPPSCGPCLGGHLGILAKGEKALATTNRNFVGRMGDPSSEVYLSGPAVAAASAVTGKISSPSEVME
jgi:3-isopropylmalate dehydratase, large subunit (EC 4.2.1.33)